MRISLEQANELLKKYLDVEVVEGDGDKDVDIEALGETITTNVTEDVRPAIEAELKDTLHQSATGRAAGATSSALARVFGMKKKDLEGLDVEGAAKKVKEYVDANNTNSGNDWQTERETLIREHEEELERVVSEKETVISDWQNKYTERDIQAAALSITGKIPRKQGDLNDHADVLLYKARQKYDVKYNEKTKSFDLYEKGTETPAKDNGKAIKVEDFARTVFDTLGIIEKDTRNVKPSDVKEGKEVHATVLEKDADFAPGVADFAASLQD